VIQYRLRAGGERDILDKRAGGGFAHQPGVENLGAAVAGDGDFGPIQRQAVAGVVDFSVEAHPPHCRRDVEVACIGHAARRAKSVVGPAERGAFHAIIIGLAKGIPRAGVGVVDVDARAGVVIVVQRAPGVDQPLLELRVGKPLEHAQGAHGRRGGIRRGHRGAAVVIVALGVAVHVIVIEGIAGRLGGVDLIPGSDQFDVAAVVGEARGAVAVLIPLAIIRRAAAVCVDPQAHVGRIAARGGHSDQPGGQFIGATHAGRRRGGWVRPGRGVIRGGGSAVTGRGDHQLTFFHDGVAQALVFHRLGARRAEAHVDHAHVCAVGAVAHRGGHAERGTLPLRVERLHRHHLTVGDAQRAAVAVVIAGGDNPGHVRAVAAVVVGQLVVVGKVVTINDPGLQIGVLAVHAGVDHAYRRAGSAVTPHHVGFDHIPTPRLVEVVDNLSREGRNGFTLLQRAHRG